MSIVLPMVHTTTANQASGGSVAHRGVGLALAALVPAMLPAVLAGPLNSRPLGKHAGWRRGVYLNLPVGAVAPVAASTELPARTPEGENPRLDATGAALLAGATAALMFTCIWGGDRYAWASVQIIGLIAATLLLSLALVVRERRAADPIVPVELLGTRVVAIASAVLFFTTASLFAITVFIPLFLQTTTGATPTQAGLLLAPMMLGVTV